MRDVRRLVGTALACGAASVASAQSGAGGTRGVNDHTVPSRLIHPEQRAQDQDEAFSSIRQLATCEAGMHTPEARTLVASPIGTPAAQAALKVMFARETSCIRFAVQIRMNDRLYRAALAEALYRSDRKKMPMPVALTEPSATEVVVRPDAGSQYAPLETFALCVADADPGGVEEMLETTRLGTAASDQSVAALSPQFGACLPANSTVKLQAMIVRMALAEAMYHRLWAGREETVAHLAGAK